MYTKRTKYFTLNELTWSNTAYRYKIDNTPSQEIIDNLFELMNVLDDIREKWGGPIKVTSGYRCDEVNKLVGGSKNSMHLKGFAADIIPYNNQMDKFIEFIREWAKDKQFDQILIERQNSARWVHIGLYSNSGKKRKQIKVINN